MNGLPAWHWTTIANPPEKSEWRPKWPPERKAARSTRRSYISIYVYIVKIACGLRWRMYTYHIPKDNDGPQQDSIFWYRKAQKSTEEHREHRDIHFFFFFPFLISNNRWRWAKVKLWMNSIVREMNMCLPFFCFLIFIFFWFTLVNRWVSNLVWTTEAIQLKWRVSILTFWIFYFFWPIW